VRSPAMTKSGESEVSLRFSTQASWIKLRPRQTVDPKNFFAEFKQRNVYKVAVAYAFVGWLAAQITATVP
jgi:hypothetical protein